MAAIMPEWWFVPVFFLIAALYAAVGHGGGSGYLAVLAVLGAPPAQMATTALTLNILVAGIALVAFARAGHFSGRLTWPFLVASVPAAWLGGFTHVSGRWYAVLLAVALTVAAWRLAVEWRGEGSMVTASPRLAVALPAGGLVGWLSGVVGVGGGIFLSPLLLLRRWATPKQAAASSACFILVNSAAGLAGRYARGAFEMGTLWPLALAAGVGGLLGSGLGAAHCSGRTLKQLLAVVLVVAALKSLTVAWRSGP